MSRPTTLKLFEDANPRPISRGASHGPARLRKDLGLVEQVRRAAHPRNRLALWIGAVFGAYVPIATYTVAHEEVDAQPLLWTLVLGGLLFSALSVFEAGRSAFGSATKSLGFVVILEGTMVFSGVGWLGHAALALLIAVNAVAAGTSLAVGRQRLAR